MELNIFEILKVIFLGIVEGITEWLPISSTGHMLLVDEFIKLNMSDAFKEMFFVVIQLGAIMAVVVLFWGKMFPFRFGDKRRGIIRKDVFSLWFKTAVACIPGAVVTILFDDFIESTIKEKYPNINLFYTGAKKLNSTLDEFFKSAKNNNPSFLISSFSTVEKGINIKIKKEFNPITMIPINEIGAEKFALLNNADVVEVDLDGLYIGDINYDYPKIEKKSTGRNRSAEILQCMYYARAYCFKEKAEKYKDDIIYAILSNDLSPFNVIHDIKTSQSTITSFLSGTGQSTGRVG